MAPSSQELEPPGKPGRFSNHPVAAVEHEQGKYLMLIVSQQRL